MTPSNNARFSRISRKSVVFGAALLASAWGCAGGELQLLGGEEGAGTSSGTAGSAGSRAGTGGSSGAGVAGSGTGATAGKGGAAGSAAGSAGKAGTGGQGGAGKSGASGAAGKAGTAGTAGSSSGAAGDAGAAGEAGSAGDAGAAGSPLGGSAGAAGATAGAAGTSVGAGAAGVAGAAGSAGSAGGGNTCTKIEDCPPTADVCLLRTCTTGVCGTAPEAAGVAVAAQTGGDCKIVTCDGSGVSVTGNDDTDAPDDQNPCTKDSCVNGTKTFLPESAGTTCGAALVCDGGGNCQGCVVGTDCPGADDECRTRTCTAGVCGATLAPQGTILTAQTTGDCKRQECDGNGGIVAVTLSTDAPDDGKDCTQNTCNGQTGAFPPAASGSACDDDGGTVCNGSGACVACISAATCPTPANECQIATCTAGVCGVGNAPVGAPVASQTAGDCKKQQCNGNGAIEAINDDGDVKDDANVCTTDGCALGVPTHLPVSVGTTCGGTQVCNATGQCVGCVTAASCPAGDECKTATCTAGICGFALATPGSATATQTANDCKKSTCDAQGNIAVVADDTDLPVDDGIECTRDICSSGNIQHPSKDPNTACGAGGTRFCDGGTACVECTGFAQCTGTDNECRQRTCNANTCGFSFTSAGFAVATQTLNDCKKNQCDGAGNIVNVNDDGDLPTDLNQCTDAVCLNGAGTLPASPAGTACSQNGGTRCNGNGACVQCNAPSDCGTDTLCLSFTCTAGICGQNNVPAGTAVGTQTAGDCKVNACDGNGNLTTGAIDNADLPNDNKQCTTDSCANGVATFTALASGAPCNEGGGTVCNGAPAVCVACVSDAQCSGATPKCTGGVCVAAPAVCGNGVKEGAEACDDNNLAANDGCSATCTIEAGATCNAGGTTCCTGGLRFTQYYEGPSTNKWLEITNVGSATETLTGYTVSLYSNAAAENWKGGTASGTNVVLSGTLAAGANLVLGNTSGTKTPSYVTPFTATSLDFNGNDSVVLWRNGASFAVDRIVDVLSFTNGGNEGADISFGRASRATGFSTASGSNILNFAAVWPSISLATVNAAASGNERIGTFAVTCP